MKVYSTFVGVSGNGAGGVLAIYTKKSSDLNSLPSSGDMMNYRGYSIIKEFYSPDYNRITKPDKVDRRITLYWNSAIVIDTVNAKIPVIFYNNDRSKQFRIVAEGMTADGKLLMIEKIITPKKAF